MKRATSKFSSATTLLVLAVLGATPFVLQALWAAETPTADSAPSATSQEQFSPALQLAQAPAAKASQKSASEAKDPFAVPKGNVDELIQFINDVQKVKAKGSSEEAQIENSRHIAEAVVTAAERILAADPTDEQAQAVASVGFQALWHLVAIGDESVLPRIDKLIEQLAKDKRPGLADLSLENSLLRRIQSWKSPTEAERTAFAKDFKKLLTSGPLTQEKLQLAMSLGDMMEQIGETKIAASVYETLIGTLPKTEEAQELVARMQGTIRRLNLPGKFMPIEGTTLDGKPFDWSAYRGKVVLVDFWATWCGPCIKELPNVIEMYEKYHDKGFEVVGISLDDDADSVKDFIADRHIPWVTLLEKNPEKRGWNTPLAEHYGISGIPATILVDKEGKVVKLSVFGETLEEQLAELLGPAE